MTFLTRGLVQHLSIHRSYLSARVQLRKMSVAATLSQLPSLLRDLITGAAQDGSEDFGKSEQDKAEVTGWIDKVAQGDVTRPENLKVCPCMTTRLAWT